LVLKEKMSSVSLRVEADQASLSQDVDWHRSIRISRFLWTGVGFALLMLMGLLGAHQSTLAPAAMDRPELAVLLAWGKRESRDARDCRVHGHCAVGICVAGECIGTGVLSDAQRIANARRNIEAETKRIAEQAKQDALARAKRSADQAKKAGLSGANHIADQAKKNGQNIQAETKRIAEQAKQDALAKAKRTADQAKKAALSGAIHITDQAKQNGQNIQAETKRIVDQAKQNSLAKVKHTADQAKKDGLPYDWMWMRQQHRG